MIGVYATTAYGVSRRRREMNIRVALGATGRDVLSLVLRQSSIPLLSGVTLGAAGALVISAVVGSLLFEMSGRDPRVVVGVGALAGATGLLASFVAARVGLAVNPAAVLRED